MKLWYKFASPSGVYFTPFGKNRTNVLHFDSPEEMSKHLNQCNSSYEIKSDKLVEIYEKTLPDIEPEELPNGLYYHKFASHGSPEKLCPLTIRDDKYINIIDNLSDLDKAVDDFINNESLYLETCSIYKLGILLFGPPGTGKTSYIREFIRRQNEAITIYMDGVPTRDFIEKLEKSTKSRLKILVFEEAVSLLENSDDIREMLDFLDGSKSISKAIYFLSTNYPESIPENVIRNGRVDLFVRVEYPSEDARKKLINLYLKREATEEEVSLTKNMPIVDIREICFSHKKTNKSFGDCVKIIAEKNNMLKKYFGKSKEIRLA